MWLYFCHILWFSYFFSHLMVSSTHCTIPTPHMIVLLSYSVIPLFFFLHLMVSSSHYAVPTSHMTVLLSHSVIFFLTFYGNILTLHNTNITCNCIFVTFGGSFFFFFSSHIWWYHSYIMEYQHHMWLHFGPTRWLNFFYFVRMLNYKCNFGSVYTSIKLTCICAQVFRDELREKS